MYRHFLAQHTLSSVYNRFRHTCTILSKQLTHFRSKLTLAHHVVNRDTIAPPQSNKQPNASLRWPLPRRSDRDSRCQKCIFNTNCRKARYFRVTLIKLTSAQRAGTYIEWTRILDDRSLLRGNMVFGGLTTIVYVKRFHPFIVSKSCCFKTFIVQRLLKF